MKLDETLYEISPMFNTVCLKPNKSVPINEAHPQLLVSVYKNISGDSFTYNVGNIKIDSLRSWFTRQGFVKILSDEAGNEIPSKR